MMSEGNTDRKRRARHARPKVSLWREILEWVITLASAFIIAILIHRFIGQGYTVLGPSMQPTLYTNEKVIISKIHYRFGEPQRGDIAVVYYPPSASNPGGSNSYVKRVIGVPGDVLAVVDGKLMRNGMQVNEPYIKENMRWDFDEITVPEDHVFVMGDNRNDSNDSRSVGAISYDNVVGKALWIYWPFSKMSSVYSLK